MKNRQAMSELEAKFQRPSSFEVIDDQLLEKLIKESEKVPPKKKSSH
jgi:hypothetical protein